MASARNQQPTFDFLTGNSPPRQPLRESTTLKQSTSFVRADISNEQLRAQINTLQYELDTIRQARELEILQYQSEVREAEKRAEADFKRAQVSTCTYARTTRRPDTPTGGRSRSQCRTQAP